MNKIIGVTGGIATGKSIVSEMFRKYHYNIIDADSVTREVQTKNSPGLNAIVRYFGRKILNQDNSLNRHTLGNIVFNDSYQLKQLTRIIDPYIREKIINDIQKISLDNNKPIILNAPTLFENGYQFLVDKIIIVYCDPITQMNRLMKRNKLSISQSSNRIASQWPMDIKIRLSDIIINNSYSTGQTKQQILTLIQNNNL